MAFYKQLLATPEYLPPIDQLVKVTSLLSWLFPVPMILQSVSTSNYSSLPTLLFPSQVVVQVSWLLYGYLTQQTTILFCSFCAAVCHAVYSSITLYNQKMLRALWALAMVVGVQTVVMQEMEVSMVGNLAMSM